MDAGPITAPTRPPRALAAALILLIVAGAALAVYQYAFNRSLWHDEAVLANNIVDRDFRGLTRPLDFQQVAPIGYLWATKLATLVLGDGEYGLRAVPLLCFLAAIPLLYLLAVRLTGNAAVALLAAAVFSLSRILLIYASEAKQYSTDVFVAVLMLYLTFALPLRRPAGGDGGGRPAVVDRVANAGVAESEVTEAGVANAAFAKSGFAKSQKRIAWAQGMRPPAAGKALALYGVAGALAVWFSNTAVIVLAACGLFVLQHEIRKRRNPRALWVPAALAPPHVALTPQPRAWASSLSSRAAPFAAWAVPFAAWSASFAVYFALFIRNHPQRAHHMLVWREYFLPLNPLSGEFYGFLPKAAQEIFFNLGFGEYWLVPAVVSILGVGFSLLNRRSRAKALYFFALPPLLHLLLSGLKMYPFVARALLYLAPMTIVMFALGLHDMLELARNRIPRFRLPRLALVLPVLVMLQPIARDFPFENQELRASLDHLQRTIRPDESIYVYYGARHAFAYYRERMGIVNPVTVGAPYPGRYAVFDEELSKLAGRVHVVFSHVYPFTPGNDEERYMIDFLRKSGAELLDARKFRGSSVYYFDTRRPRSDSK